MPARNARTLKSGIHPRPIQWLGRGLLPKLIKKKLRGEFESEKRRILSKKKEEVLELGLKYKTLNDFCAYLINNCEGMSEAEQDFLLNKPRALYDLTNAWLNTGMVYKPSIDWLNVEMKIRAEKGA